MLAKFRLGWELEDELAGTRNLLEALLAWFRTQDPSMQQEALKLFVITIKVTTYIYIYFLSNNFISIISVIFL